MNLNGLTDYINLNEHIPIFLMFYGWILKISKVKTGTSRAIHNKEVITKSHYQFPAPVIEATFSSFAHPLKKSAGSYFIHNNLLSIKCLCLACIAVMCTDARTCCTFIGACYIMHVEYLIYSNPEEEHEILNMLSNIVGGAVDKDDTQKRNTSSRFSYIL